ncbi:restriction endonuclease subunit S [Leptospira kanakyensis]|uniref:restriction endonuclease subunit S n=1 Tax=Leptospira kanakyensis TaxID=2484968 RepID=UPI00223CD600|nr:restriction endonuclease subunit S [Leptospira kanakyensis]MCW7468191.1 restriction endonuclease subunit S [Leptospira kanakyensis]
MAEGKIKKSEALPAVKEEEKPFVIPKGWEWVRLGESTHVIMGQSPDSRTYNQIAVGLPFYQGKSDYGKLYPTPKVWCSSPVKIAPKNSILISVRAPIGPTNLCQEDSCIGRGLSAIIPLADCSLFFYLYLLRKFEAKLASYGTGSTFQAITQKVLINFPLPLPPLAEQKRIVDKIGELFLLCDELETLKKSKDTKRKDLHQSVITQMLEADSQESFQKHFQFLTTHFQELYSVKENVKELRKAVLQLAVMGKLVPQDPNDQPASELLKEIQAEKARLLAEGKIKKSEALPVVKEEEKPFVIPKGWEWVRLGEVLQKFGAGSTPLGGKSVYTTDGIMFLRSQNVWNDGLYLDDVARISKSIHEKMKGTKVIGNDILLNITGASIGRSTIFPLNFEEANVSQHVAILRTFTPSIVTYLHKLIISDFFQNLVFKEQVGVSREGLSMTKLSKFPLPLPPLAEQKRIVEKVDEFLALCDELEERIGKAEEKRGEILKGMVRV